MVVDFASGVGEGGAEVERFGVVGPVDEWGCERGGDERRCDEQREPQLPGFGVAGVERSVRQSRQEELIGRGICH